MERRTGKHDLDHSHFAIGALIIFRAMRDSAARRDASVSWICSSYGGRFRNNVINGSICPLLLIAGAIPTFIDEVNCAAQS